MGVSLGAAVSGVAGWEHECGDPCIISPQFPQLLSLEMKEWNSIGMRGSNNENIYYRALTVSEPFLIYLLYHVYTADEGS